MGCFAHVRRKFDEALKAQDKKTARVNPKLKPESIAAQALTIIQQLYRIEADINALPPEQKRMIRQEQAVPILNQLRGWLDQALNQVTPLSLTGKALAYLHKQ